MPYDYGVIGDSIPNGSRTAIRNQMGPSGRVFAANGQTVRQQLDAMRRFVASSSPDAPAYINLGTNDVFRGNRGGRAIRQALSILGDRPVQWLNVRSYGVSPYYGRDWHQNAQAFNRRLSNIAQYHPNMQVLDWDAESRGNRDWFLGDGLHLNNMGRGRYAHFIAANKPAPYEPPVA